MQPVKFQRIPHLHSSPGFSSDDIFTDIEQFIGKHVIITEKLDGECTSLYSNHIHARSVSSRDHVSRSWIKNIHGQIKHEIPENMRICGENLFAKHSIFYSSLPSYFMVFAIYIDDSCLSWSETKEYANLLGLNHVPELFNGIATKNVIESCFSGKSQYDGEQEGYVIRTNDGSMFAKYVRKGHVQTTEHWLNQMIVQNGLNSVLK
jgi:hypothetical protein